MSQLQYFSIATDNKLERIKKSTDDKLELIYKSQIDEIEKIQRSFEKYDFKLKILNRATRLVCSTYFTFLLLNTSFPRIFYENKK